MVIIDKIKKILLNIYYGLPHGLKAADAEIMGGGSQDSIGTSISQEVNDQRVGRHLLKGEVTQEVEELRYRTYAVANESENYKYLGNGIAVKEEKEKTTNNRKKFKFTQENENICESVLDTLKQVGSYGIEKYRFEIDYESLVRFKLEKFATKVDVSIDDDEGIIETVIHFNTEPNPYDGTSQPFINEIKKLKGVKNEYEIKRNELASSIKNLSFSTYRAYGEDDFVTYSFTGGAKFVKLEEIGYEYLMTLSWDEYIRLPLNLEAKYYSKTMAEKYKNKERKDVAVSMVNVERKRYCSVCGKEMSVYDADIQEASGQEIICKDCLQQAMSKQENK